MTAYWSGPASEDATTAPLPRRRRTRRSDHRRAASRAETRTRQQTWRDVATVSAIHEKDVTRRTNILVIGDLNPAVLIPGAITSGKAAHAFALQAKGQEIEVMTEEDFLRSL